MTESAEGMRRVGVMDDAAYKLTMRDLNRTPPEETVLPITGREIKRATRAREIESGRFRALPQSDG
jgi:hypothetical protein